MRRFGFAFAALCFGFCGSAWAAERIELKYIAGIESVDVASFELSIELDSKQYELKGQMESSSLIGWIAEGQARLDVSGRLAGGKARPRNYRLWSDTGGAQWVDVLWRGGKQPQIKTSKPLHPEKRQSLLGALNGRIADPASFFVQTLFHPHTSTLCSRQGKVFDGRQIHHYRFQPAKSLTSETASSRSVERCNLQLKTVAGLTNRRAALQDKLPPFEMEVGFHAIKSGQRPYTVPAFVKGEPGGLPITIRLMSARVIKSQS